MKLILKSWKVFLVLQFLLLFTFSKQNFPTNSNSISNEIVSVYDQEEVSSLLEYQKNWHHFKTW
jgi:uncharacterized membrane protein YvbJ